LREAEAKTKLGSDYHVGERCAAKMLDCIASRYWYIYIGVPLRNPREGGCAEAGSLTARDGGARETLKPWMPQLGGTPNELGQTSRKR
jgi:hypothetical protein